MKKIFRTIPTIPPPTFFPEPMMPMEEKINEVVTRMDMSEGETVSRIMVSAEIFSAICCLNCVFREKCRCLVKCESWKCSFSLNKFDLGVFLVLKVPP